VRGPRSLRAPTVPPTQSGLADPTLKNRTGVSLLFLPLFPPPHSFHVSWLELFTMDLGETILDYGCALQVKLLIHLFRVFSLDVVYPNFEAAKATSAADAISDGMDRLLRPRRLFQEDDTMSTPQPVALTLQVFFGDPAPIAGARRRQDGGRDQCARLAERSLPVCA